MKAGEYMSTKTGRLLKQLRKERQLTLKEAAEAIGCSPSFLHRLENNTRKNPSFETATKLATFYDIDVNLLASDNSLEIDYAMVKMGMQKEIADEFEATIEKVKEGLTLFEQDSQKSKQAFIEVQKSLLFIKSLS